MERGHLLIPVARILPVTPIGLTLILTLVDDSSGHSACNPHWRYLRHGPDGRWADWKLLEQLLLLLAEVDMP